MKKKLPDNEFVIGCIQTELCSLFQTELFTGLLVSIDAVGAVFAAHTEDVIFSPVCSPPLPH